MAKKKLQTESIGNFLLWGVLSSKGGHKIAWEINNAFPFKLHRQEDVVLERQPSNENLYFNFYAYEDEINFFKIELIKNKSLGGYYLKELKNFDFILMVKGELDFFEIDVFSALLKKMPSIQSAIAIDLSKIKGLSQLILE